MKTHRSKAVWAVVALMLAVFWGCSRREEEAETVPTSVEPPSSGGGAVIVPPGEGRLLADLAPDDVIVTVNGVALTRREYDVILESMTQSFLRARPNRTPREANLFRQRRGRTLINEFLTKQLMLQEATRRGLKPSPDRLADMTQRAEDAAKRAGKSLEAFLAESPQGPEAMKQNIEEQALIQTLRDVEFGDRLRVTDEDVANALARLERSQNEVAATNRVRQAETRDLRRRILEGADFAALADEYSLGGDGEGGEMGDMEYSAFDNRQVRYALSVLPIGEVSEVIETEEGWEIYKALGRTAATETEPGTVNPARILIPKIPEIAIPSPADLRRQLETSRLAETQGPWLDALRKASVLTFPNGTNLWPRTQPRDIFGRTSSRINRREGARNEVEREGTE